ncbi:hypothetical protein PR202_ga08103 [Eleusine coracana subsp. coracana]|uniref:Uncharacterized protein n=1 Tax=Eleusine coracana subsp. coracana TaxID=191504 RepID=A0AAV5C1B7_ELECO|nr:hypothetical protein PR202_ga08103 [Eleusine coracana subsp. coracana]
MRQRSGLVVEAGERVVDVPGYVSGAVVAKVVAYWEAAAVGSFDDAEFLGELRHDARVDIIHAAYHLRDAALFNLFRFGAA